MNENDRIGTDSGDDKHVDAWLRRELEPDREIVELLVRRSLRARPAARSRRRRFAAVTVTATVALVAALLILFPRPGERGPDTATEHRTPRVAMLTITNESGEVEVLYPAHRPREITIFNSDGIVAAIVPTPISHHFILGGDS